MEDLLAPMTRLEPGQTTTIIIIMDEDQDPKDVPSGELEAALRSVRRALDGGEQGPPIIPPTHPVRLGPFSNPRLRRPCCFFPRCPARPASINQSSRQRRQSR
jgi:hypothetical protein